MTEAVTTPPVETPPVETPPVNTPPAPAANWRDGLPDDLKADATLARFGDVEALARGHLDTQKLARSKLAIPGEGATLEQWGAVWDALGRPKSADDYDVPMPELALPEGASDDDKAAAAEALKTEYAPFRALAHEIGLTAEQAKRLGQYELDRQNAYVEKTKADLDAFKGSMPEAEFNARMEAAKAVAKLIGLPEDFADDLERKAGTAALLKGFFKLADISGELPRIGGEGGDFGVTGESAEAQLQAKFKDKSWREKYQAGDVAVRAEHERLMKLAKDQALGKA